MREREESGYLQTTPHGQSHWWGEGGNSDGWATVELKQQQTDKTNLAGKKAKLNDCEAILDPYLWLNEGPAVLITL